MPAAVVIVRMNVVGPTVTQFLFHGAASELEPLAVKPGTQLVGSADPDLHRRAIRHGAEALLAGPERLLCAFAAGDIARDFR